MPNVLSTKAILANVTVRCWTGRKLDRIITDEVNQQHNAEADAGRYNKLLISKTAFAEVYSIERTARVTHHVMTLPWLDEGTRILPSVMYAEFANRFGTFRSDFNDAADRFNKNYPLYVKGAKKRLNGMFREKDYPDPSRVRGMFQFTVGIRPCPDVGDFRVSLAKEQMDDVRSALETDMQSALDQAMKEPVRRMIAVVEKMATKLKGYKPPTDEDRAEGTFRDTLVTNISDLIPLLGAFNLTGDKDITALIKRAEKELCAVEAVDLREDDAVRSKVQKAAEDILKQAQALMA